MTKVTLSILASMLVMAGTAAAQEPENETKEQKEERLASAQGKFTFGGRARFPTGPDGMGNYKPFKWIALDLQGRYNVTDQISTYLTIPLAIVKPKQTNMVDNELFGGFMGKGELKLGGTIGAAASAGMLREGAVLLSEKDFPLYQGDLKFATLLGPFIKLKTGVINLRLEPVFVYQAGDETITGVQVPVSAMVRAGEAIKVSVDIGLYSGDDFKLGADEGGRVGVGAAVDLKLGKIILHLGAGFASLLVDDAPSAAYHSIGDSLYFDLNVKFAN